MKKSKFEGYSDKILFKFLKVILSTLDEEGINHINMKFNDEFTSSVDDALQFFGDTPLDYIDYDYLFELIKRNVTEPEFQIESPQMLYVNQKCSGWVPAQRYNLAPLNKFLPMDFQLTSITIPSTFKTPEPNGNNLMMIAFMFLLFIRNLNRNKYRILTRENRQ